MMWFVAAPVVLPVMGLSLPQSWLVLLGNTVTQYPGLSSVCVCVSECVCVCV